MFNKDYDRVPVYEYSSPERKIAERQWREKASREEPYFYISVTYYMDEKVWWVDGSVIPNYRGYEHPRWTFDYVAEKSPWGPPIPTLEKQQSRVIEFAQNIHRTLRDMGVRRMVDYIYFDKAYFND